MLKKEAEKTFGFFKRIVSLFPARIFLVALFLRLIPVVFSFNLTIGLDDMFQYDMLARSIVAGNGYRWYAQPDLNLVEPYIHFDLTTVNYNPLGVPTSFRPPLYPVFLAIIYFLTGTGPHRFFAARLVQVFVGAALIPLTYALARHFFPENERAAKIAAVVVAFYPMLVIYPLSLATENLFFVLMLSAMLVLLIAKDNIYKVSIKEYQQTEKINFGSFVSFIIKTRWFILAGILLGLTTLTRSVALAFSGLAVLWIWFEGRERKMAVVTLLVVAFVTLPWMVRNTLLNHRLTGIESALGYDLYVSYHPQSSGTFQYPQSLDLLSILDDAQRNEIGLEKTREFIQANPTRVLYLMVRRFGYFFGLERRALTYFYSNNFFGNLPTPGLIAAATLVLMPFVLVSTSAAFGMALVRWSSETRLLALLFVGYIIPHILIIAEDRFHLTLVPFLAILAAKFWTCGWSALKSRWHTRTGKIEILLTIIAVVLLFLNWGLELWRDAGKIAQLLGPNGNQTYFPY